MRVASEVIAQVIDRGTASKKRYFLAVSRCKQFIKRSAPQRERHKRNTRKDREVCFWSDAVGWEEVEQKSGDGSACRNGNCQKSDRSRSRIYISKVVEVEYKKDNKPYDKQKKKDAHLRGDERVARERVKANRQHGDEREGESEDVSEEEHRNAVFGHEKII